MTENVYHDIDSQHHNVLKLAEKESKQHPFNIRACKKYYDIKLKGEEEILKVSTKIQKTKIEIKNLKSIYRQSMSNLETISTKVQSVKVINSKLYFKIHARRQNSRLSQDEPESTTSTCSDLPVRTCGDGLEEPEKEAGDSDIVKVSLQCSSPTSTSVPGGLEAESEDVKD